MWSPASLNGVVRMSGNVDMPTLQRILGESRVERRAIGRTRINRGALLFFSGQVGVVGCSVRDVTNEGAGIRLDRLPVIPIDFKLSFDNFRTMRNCHLVWREGDFVGVSLDREKHQCVVSGYGETDPPVIRFLTPKRTADLRAYGTLEHARAKTEAD
jgi:hypothetical protein